MKLRLALIAGVLGALVIGVSVPAEAALRPMKEIGATTSPMDLHDCADSPYICGRFEASAHGKPIKGTFKGKIEMGSKGDFFENADGKTCTFLKGTGKFKNEVLIESIEIAHEGLWCTGSVAPVGAPGVLKSVYEITGGKGDFASAKGRGGLTMHFTYNSPTDMTYRLDGTLKV